MTFNLDSYLNAIKQPIIHPRAKLEFLYDDENVREEVTGDLLGGTLTISLVNGSRRYLDIQIILDEKYIPRLDGLIWANSKFRLSLGLRINGEDMLLQQGVFIATTPRLSSGFSNSTMQIRGIDKFGKLDGTLPDGITEFTTSVTNGSSIFSFIRTTLNDFNDPKTPILDQDLGNLNTVYTIYEPMGNPIADTLEDLRQIASADMYYDRFGNFIFEKPILDIEKPSRFDFDTSNSEYLGSTLSIPTEKFINSVRVVGDNVNGDIADYRAENINPLSPISIDNIGRKPLPPITDNNISTTTLARERAEYELRQRSIVQGSITLMSIPLIHLDVNDVITITDSNLGLDKERFVINRITITLGSNQTGTTMTINATRARDLELS